MMVSKSVLEKPIIEIRSAFDCDRLPEFDNTANFTLLFFKPFKHSIAPSKETLPS